MRTLGRTGSRWEVEEEEGGGGFRFNLTSRRPVPSPPAFNRHIIQLESFIEAAVVERCCGMLKRRPAWPGGVPASDLCVFVASMLDVLLIYMSLFIAV